MNWHFILLFENNVSRKRHRRYFLSTVEIKYYNVMIGGKNLFDQPVKKDLRIYDNIQKIATDQGDDYIAGPLLDNNYFKQYYKTIATYLNNH